MSTCCKTSNSVWRHPSSPNSQLALFGMQESRRAIKRLIAGDILLRAFCQYKGWKLIHSGARIHIHYTHICGTWQIDWDSLQMQIQTVSPLADFPSAVTTFLCELINYLWCLWDRLHTVWVCKQQDTVKGAGYPTENFGVCSLLPAALHLTLADSSYSIAHHNISNWSTI